MKIQKCRIKRWTKDSSLQPNHTHNDATNSYNHPLMTHHYNHWIYHSIYQNQGQRRHNKAQNQHALETGDKNQEAIFNEAVFLLNCIVHAATNVYFERS